MSEIIKNENSNEVESYYKILGLPENASKETVKSRYGALLRSYKQRTAENGETYDDIDYRNKITLAYDRIMGLSYNFEDDNPSSKIPLKIRRAWGKFLTFLDTYKLAVFIGFAVILLGTVFVIQLLTGKKYDIAVKFVGAFYTENETKTIDEFNKAANSIESAQITYFTVTTETNAYDQNAMTQATAFLSQLMAGGLDVCLIDKDSFDVYVKQKAFLSLDEMIAEHEQKTGKLFDRQIYIYSQVEDEEHSYEIEEGIYGFDITDCEFFNDVSLAWLYNEEKGQQKSMIFAICRTSKRPEVAWSLAEDILEYTK